jgi:hypothetical protein
MDTKRIPQALKQEHDNLRANLASAAAEPGALGQAARSLAEILQPHFEAEEHLVYPALAYLPALVDGHIAPDAATVIAGTRRLKAALPEMLAQHRAMRDALEKLRGAAVAASRPSYERFADSLVDHFDTEEEVLYLAAILVGEHLALRLERERPGGTIRTWGGRAEGASG